MFILFSLFAISYLDLIRSIKIGGPFLYISSLLCFYFPILFFCLSWRCDDMDIRRGGHVFSLLIFHIFFFPLGVSCL
jgi:hypothetical protein